MEVLLLLRVLGFAVAGGKEGPLGVLPELVHQATEAAGSITETFRGLGGGKSLDKIGAEGLVLAMAGVAGLQEVVGECQFFLFTDKHISTQSTASLRKRGKQGDAENSAFSRKNSGKRLSAPGAIRGPNPCDKVEECLSNLQKTNKTKAPGLDFPGEFAGPEPAFVRREGACGNPG